MVDDQTVLVAGGAGFIGSRYVHRIAQDHPNWSIRVLDLLTYSGNPANLTGLEDRITFFHGDIADRATVDEAARGCTAILNFAAESHVDRSLVDHAPFIHTNVHGTQVLLDACRRHDMHRYLHVSTDEVYGDLAGSDHRSVESDPMQPSSPYASSKAEAEELVNAAHRTHGLDILITRGSNTYGSNQYPEKIIPLFITNAIDNIPLPIYGNGHAVRDYMHVDDHCAGIDLLFHKGTAGQTYNLGANLEINGITVAESILDLLNRPKSLMAWVDDRPGHDYRYAVDSSAAESIGWNRTTNFEQGLESTVRWYVEHEDWWRPLKESRQFTDFSNTWYADRDPNP